MIKICEICKKEFKTKPSHFERRRTCSTKCMGLLKENHEKRNCIICSTEFKYYKSTKGSVVKYCSLQCKGKGLTKKRILKKCIICFEEFVPNISYEQKKYCSHECYGKTMENKTKPSFWETSTYEEQINRLKESYEKYVIRNEVGCWGWKGSLSMAYGRLQFGGKYKSISAHRASWLIHYGPIPEGMFVCHICDTPSCNRPLCLFLGTAKDNVNDMVKKGRNNAPKGEKSSASKLNNEQVLAIKKELINESIYEIAKKYGVSHRTIGDIKNNVTWRHIKC